MSLGDFTKPGGPKKPDLAIEIKPEPVSVDDAASDLLKAIHGNDVKGVADALRLGHAACEDEMEGPDDEDKGE